MSSPTSARGWVQLQGLLWCECSLRACWQWGQWWLCATSRALMFVCVCPSPAQRLCQRHHPCRELHQRRAGCPPGHPLQPEPAPGSLPQAHPAVPGQAHRGSHCVSSLCSTHCWVLCFVSSRADFRLCLSTTYRPGAASDLNLPVHSSKYQMNGRQFFCLRVVSPKVKLTEGNLFVK